METKNLTEKQRESAELISKELLRETRISRRNEVNLNIEEFPTFQGEFKAKINKLQKNRIRKHGSTCDIQLRFKKVEIGDVTGQQFLHILEKVIVDNSLIQPGDCIVMLINKSEASALVAFSDECIELLTPSPSSDDEKGYYTILFDEKTRIKSARAYPQNYGQANSLRVRKGFPNILTNFYQMPVLKTSKPYRNACFGLLFDLAKLKLESTLSVGMRVLPIAALIWIAVFNKMSENLQVFFGEHYLPKKSEARENTAGYSLRSTRGHVSLTTEEIISFRKYASYNIITEAMQINKDGSYEENKLRNTIQKIQAFYQSDSSVSQ